MDGNIQEVGSKLGMEWRDGKTAAVGSTDRIKRLNQMLHSYRPMVELQFAFAVFFSRQAFRSAQCSF